MNKLLFHPVPPGASGTRVPRAAAASAKTSRELVRGEEPDAGYFRTLEQGGILLNASQIAAVRHGDGPLLTLAGAGSGKTSVLVCRTGYLLSVRRVSPGRLLLLTFSSRAAAEMRERIGRLPGISGMGLSGLQARTFHSFFLYVLRRQGVMQEIFHDTRRQHILLKSIMRELGLPKDAYPPESLLSLLSACKMNMGDADTLPDLTNADKEIKEILKRYEQWKRDNGKIDFDDVLLHAYQMLLERPELLAELQRTYQYIMVDEFQDTNLLQYELIRMIARPHGNLMVVGDDDQTIYSFNGARSDFILEFEQVYPEAKVITLDINYRSGPAIIGLGNGIIRGNTRRRAKTLRSAAPEGVPPRYLRPYTADEEAEAVVEYIASAVEQGARSYGDFAVLYRASSSSRAVLERLLIQGIPYIDYGEGRLLYEHWLISPVVSYLRLTVNRRDFAAIENMLPTLYVGREQGMAHIHRMEAAQPKQGPLIHLLSLPGLADFRQTAIRERLDMLRHLRELTPLQAIRQIRSRFYDSFVLADERHQATLHRETLKEMLDELELSAGRFGSIPLFLDFIDDVMSRNEHHRQPSGTGQGDRVALMTIHKSKGLEFPVVLLLGASEGILPHSSALEAGRLKDRQTAEGGGEALALLEEERRLAYVAVTRAKEELLVSSPALHRGRKAPVSRFMLAAFGAAEAAGAAAASAPGGRSGGGVARHGRTSGTAGGAGEPAGRSGYGGSADRHGRTGGTAGGAGEPASRGSYGGGADRHGRTGDAAGGAGESAGRSGHGGGVDRHGRVSGAAGGAGEPAGRTRTVAVWSCPSAACPGWMRVKTGGAEDHLAHKPCPLCGTPMERGTRDVPV
ncbi:UvrD-helicase domain-containing protein [Paenibacillus sabinae]|uniref:DNA 3'-5' helicase n=1 Tax=Paenibacillus sabinae T27 TaxID=1268072 RepID=X4ZRV9_9BACL|nr:UvrD-helicase domain-containing protein [Paenibacillus sabinae]AHV95193.1 UvrD/REP helicase [Paenibacillus sabinae T27]